MCNDVMRPGCLNVSVRGLPHVYACLVIIMAKKLTWRILCVMCCTHVRCGFLQTEVKTLFQCLEDMDIPDPSDGRSL